MSNLWLALFDCAGIQNYVFASNRLREIIGASELVANATQVLVDESVRGAVQNACLDRWKVDSDRNRLYILDGDGPDAETVYQGGGNALVLFRKDTEAHRCLEIWSEKLLRKTTGINPAAVVAPLRGSLGDSLTRAHADLARLKRSHLPAARLEGIGITRTCATTGFAATDSDIDPDKSLVWISAESKRKREATGSANTRLRDAFSKVLGKDYSFPVDFEDLGVQQEESHIAVVHADGNGMGERFKVAATLADDQDATTPEGIQKAVENLRALSLDVDRAGHDALESVLTSVRDGMTGWLVERGIAPVQDRDARRLFLPVRPLVYGGDDMTLVCDGRLGLPLAAAYLAELSKIKISDGAEMGACAGVCIVRSHFPVGRAYTLAEAACHQSKTSRKEARNQDSSWLDFHIALSGVGGSLETIRKKEYYSADKQALHWRPWRVAPRDENDDHDWSVFEKGLEIFQERWPRSRSKGLRAALFEGITASTEALEIAKSRGCTPLKVPGGTIMDSIGWNVATDVRHTAYFDMLEAMDYFIPLVEPTSEYGLQEGDARA